MRACTALWVQLGRRRASTERLTGAPGPRGATSLTSLPGVGADFGTRSKNPPSASSASAVGPDLRRAGRRARAGRSPRTPRNRRTRASSPGGPRSKSCRAKTSSSHADRTGRRTPSPQTAWLAADPLGGRREERLGFDRERRPLGRRRPERAREPTRRRDVARAAGGPVLEDLHVEAAPAPPQHVDDLTVAVRARTARAGSRRARTDRWATARARARAPRPPRASTWRTSASAGRSRNATPPTSSASTMIGGNSLSSSATTTTPPASGKQPQPRFHAREDSPRPPRPAHDVRTANDKPPSPASISTTSPVVDLARQQLERQLVLDLALDQPLQRARAERRVVALVGQVLRAASVRRHGELALRQPRAQDRSWMSHDGLDLLARRAGRTPRSRRRG